MRFGNWFWVSATVLIPSGIAWAPASFVSRRNHAVSCLSAPVAPDDTLLTTGPRAFSTQDKGGLVAEGAIVSFFRGGLLVVRLSDAEITNPTQEDIDVTAIAPKMEGKKSDDFVGRLVEIPNGSMGVVVAQRPPVVFVYTDCKDISRGVDGLVQVFDTMARISIPENGLVGSVLDGFGLTDSAPTATKSLNRAVLAPTPQLKDIALINSPMLTGTTMIDVLAPIGKGQNMLMIGSDISEMRGVACDFISTQLRNPNSKCIYAITHDREQALAKLEQAGVLDETIVVAVEDDTRDLTPSEETSKTAEATVVASTACAIGEALALNNGHDSLVVVDTINQHKDLWDASTRVLVDVFGVDAVVKADREGGASSEMRAFFSTLIQRAAQFKEGGSVTLVLMTTIPGTNDGSEQSTFEESDFERSGERIQARIKMLVQRGIPLTAENLRKIQIPIPSASEGYRRLALQHVDDLISMSDGQIWLDDVLQSEGQRPPMDPQRSITRIGIGADTVSRADAPALRRIVEGLRLDLAQAASMEGAEATAASHKQKRRRDAWLLAMHQEGGQGGRSLAESCVALLGASTGAFDETLENGGLAGTKMGQAVVKQLLDHVKSVAPGAIDSVEETLEMTPEIREELEEAVQSFVPKI